jgi:hypothetical protein
MSFRTKWAVSIVVGGVLIAVVLLAFPDVLFLPVRPSLNALVSVFLWPVFLCEFLAGPGPSIGPPSKHLHEGTPVHMLAAVVGVALSWMFWSSLIFFLIRAKNRQSSE